MSDFTGTELQLIKELSFDPRFASICSKLATDHGHVTRYRPGSKVPEVEKTDWIYRSGVADGVELVLKSMGYDY